MSKEWAATITAIVGGIVAVLASLYGLGVYAPGVVAGLLIAFAILAMNVYLILLLKTLMTDALKRETDYAEGFKNVALFMQAQAALEQANILAIQRLVDKDNLESRVVELEVAKAAARDAAALAKSVARDAVALAEEVKCKV